MYGRIGIQNNIIASCACHNMSKWADYVIVGVKYGDGHSRIIKVKRCTDSGRELVNETIERRVDIVDDIKKGYTHVTAYWKNGQ